MLASWKKNYDKPRKHYKAEILLCQQSLSSQAMAFLRRSKYLLISYCLYVESLTDDTKELIYKKQTDSQTKRIDL